MAFLWLYHAKYRRLPDFSHSVNVAKEAKKLAKHYGADENKAEIAGILHDITKEMPKEQQLQIIIDSGIILDNVQLHAPKLWHGMSGSIVVRDELGIDDEDILNAIRYHTTGRAGMSLLEKVIFTADFTSEERCNCRIDAGTCGVIGRKLPHRVHRLWLHRLRSVGCAVPA